MKVHLKFKNLRYAMNVVEFLYKLHPTVLEEALDLKRRLGSILGFNDLNNFNYQQREQLIKLKFKEDNLH